MTTATAEARPVTATLDVRAITPTVGAIIGGVDLRAPLEPDTIAAIRQTLLERGVVFLRDQELDRDRMRSFVAQFGEPIPEPFGAAGRTEPVMEANVTPFRNATAVWHADVTCIDEPVSLIALRSIELPPLGGDTCWANMYAAYDALSEPLQAMLDGLTAVHSAQRVLQLLGNSPYAPLKNESVAVHPVIRVHPETGRKALFVNALWTDRIVELPQAESDRLLAHLHEHVKSPNFNMRWCWKPNDVALWDNRSTQHYAVPDYQATRVMQKVVLRGDRPVGPS